MQPNQQYPPQNTPPVQGDGYVSPSGSNVPEFLHLDPIPDPRQQKTKKRPLVIVCIIAATLLLLGVAVAVWYWNQGAYERRFYEVLDNMLKTSYISREYNVKVNDSESVLASSATDYSNVSSPKTRIEYTAHPRGLSVGGESNPALSGEIVAINDSFVARLSQAPKSLLPKGAELNKWYTIKNPTVNTKTVTAAVFDFLKLRRLFNTIYGLVPIANISKEQRAEIIDFMKLHKVYTIDAATGDSGTTMYTISINSKAFSMLNDKIAEVLKIPAADLIYQPADYALHILVDDNSASIKEITQKSKTEGGRPSVTIKQTYAYPSKIDIERPSDAIDLQ